MTTTNRDELLVTAVWTGFDVAQEVVIEFAQQLENNGLPITTKLLQELFTRWRSEILANGLVEEFLNSRTASE